MFPSILFERKGPKNRLAYSKLAYEKLNSIGKLVFRQNKKEYFQNLEITRLKTIRATISLIILNSSIVGK
jgi:hypothetical protein